MAILIQQSEATAAYRRMYFHCVDASDGMSPETGEAVGQPQISLNGGGWGNTTNTLIAIGNGRYYVELVADTEVNSLGIIEGRYKSANTAEAIGTTLQVVPFDPYDGVRAGLTALPNAAADAAGGLPISDTGGLDMDAKLANTNEVTAARMAELDAANLPTDVALINADVVTVDGVVDAIKAVTDALPDAGALSTIDTNVDSILADTGELQTDWVNGGRLDLLIDAILADVTGLNGDAMRGTDGANTTVPDAAGTAAGLHTTTDAAIAALNNISTAQVNAEVDAALADIHLDHLLAATYDPAAKPGAVDALLNELVENDGGVSRYTANSLEQAPSGGTNPNVLVDTTLASVTSQTEFILTAGSNDDDAYKDQAIVLYDADDSDYPSTRVVTAYVGSTKTVTIDSAPDFTIVTGDGVKVFVTAPGTSAPTAAQVADAIWDEARADHLAAGTFGQSLQLIRAGTAQAGAASTITLDASASAISNFYVNCTICIISGTGVSQSRRISGYVGTTKVATVANNWYTNPDNTSVFIILPRAEVNATVTSTTINQIADQVWDEAASGHVGAGTFGTQCGTDIDAILTDTGTTLQAELDAIEAAVITNAAGADIAADIIEIKAETAAIINDTDVIDDATSGLVKIAGDVADILVDTGTTIPGTITTAQSDLDLLTGTDGATLATAQANYAPAKAGDLMGLANDAITSAKYDESTAFPVAATDTGATQIARVGADSDTLETLSDQIDGVGASTDVESIMGTNLAETNAGDLANNISQFFDVNPTTTKDVDDVGGGAATVPPALED